MHRAAIPLLASLLVGCGDSTGPVDLSKVPAALSVVAGADQTDSIGATLATAITVRLTTADASALPIPGTVVSFVVTSPNCGRAFAGSAATNADGRASERWELGTKAGACTMEARAVDADGTPRVLATVQATVLPGRADSIAIDERAVAMFLGQSIDTAGMVRGWDRARNRTATSHTVGGRLTSDVERYDTVRVTLGSIVAKKPVMWLADLRRSSWSLSYACRTQVAASDSIGAELATDEMTYGVGGVVNLTVSGTERDFRQDSIRSFAVSRRRITLNQIPGEVSGMQANGPVPTAYSGGDLCQLLIGPTVVPTRPPTFAAR